MTTVDLPFLRLPSTLDDTLGEEVGRKLCRVVVSLYSISVNTADSLASRQDNANLGGGFKADGSLFTYVSCGVLLYHLGRAIY